MVIKLNKIIQANIQKQLTITNFLSKYKLRDTNKKRYFILDEGTTVFEKVLPEKRLSIGSSYFYAKLKISSLRGKFQITSKNNAYKSDVLRRFIMIIKSKYAYSIPMTTLQIVSSKDSFDQQIYDRYILEYFNGLLTKKIYKGKRIPKHMHFKIGPRKIYLYSRSKNEINLVKILKNDKIKCDCVN